MDNYEISDSFLLNLIGNYGEDIFLDYKVEGYFISLGKDDRHSPDYEINRERVRKKKHDLIIDLAAMANTNGQKLAVIITGVEETTDGLRKIGIDRKCYLDNNYQEILISSVKPVLNFTYREVMDSSGMAFGFFIIKNNGLRPYALIKDLYGPFRRSTIPIRLGSSNAILADFGVLEEWKKQDKFSGDNLTLWVEYLESAIKRLEHVKGLQYYVDLKCKAKVFHPILRRDDGDEPPKNKITEFGMLDNIVNNWLQHRNEAYLTEADYNQLLEDYRDNDKKPIKDKKQIENKKEIKEFLGTLDKIKRGADGIVFFDMDKIASNYSAPALKGIYRILRAHVVDKNQLILLGDYGTGKTTYSHHLFINLARSHLKNPQKYRIPILIDLKNYNNSRSLSTMFNEHLNDYGLNYIDFKRLSDKGKTVAILDGLDEMSFAAYKRLSLDNIV